MSIFRLILRKPTVRHDPPYPTGTPFFGEIRFRLSHSAITSTLIELNSWGNGAGVFDGIIVFDDSAAAVVNFGAAPVSGTFMPTGAGMLSGFDGGLAVGVWSLFIEDSAEGDALRFRSFTLNVTTSAAVAVPEPGSVALLSLGCCGLFVRAYRRRSRTIRQA